MNKPITRVHKVPRFVDKEPTLHRGSAKADALSVSNTSAGWLSGLRSYRRSTRNRTLLQLRHLARKQGVKGLSTMNKAQLEAALT